MSHPFGDLLRKHLSLRHGFSQNKLADCAGETPSVISEMCHGKRLTGWLARERVVQIVLCLHQEGVLDYLGDASALLAAANMTDLSTEDPIEAELLRVLKTRAYSAPFLAPPKPAHPLIGREACLRELKVRLLELRDMNLCAFVGLPGVGKTSLAIELSHSEAVMAHFCDGVLWAGLGRAPDVLAILGAWAMALGFTPQEVADRPSVEARQALLNAVIGQQSLLLVLDDVWTPDVIRSFCVGGPNCVSLITTRHPTIALDFAGDNVQTIPELPPADGVALLNAMAPAVVAADPEAAQGLVSAVGGLPLAIILMGRYLRQASYAGQTRRIRAALRHLLQADKRLQLEQPLLDTARLASEGTVLSLQSIIAFSDEVLDAATRASLYALSVFPAKPNTFAESAALAVIGQPPAILDQLVDSGLLEPSGSERYTLHQAIADYAGSQLADASAVENMIHFLRDYVRRHSLDYVRLDLEKENILAAIEHAFERALYADFVQGVNDLFPYLRVRGLYALAVALLERAEPLVRELGSADQETVTLRNLGEMLQHRGDYSQAKGYLLECLSLACDHNSSEHLLELYACLGSVCIDLEEYEQAMLYSKKGLALAEELGDLAPTVSMLQCLGAIMGRQGDYEEAEAYFLQALDLAKRFGNYEKMTLILGNLGVKEIYQGNYDMAQQYLSEGLAAARRLGHRKYIAYLLHNLGLVAEKRHAYAQALVYYDEAIEIAEKIRPDDMWLLLTNKASILTALDDFEPARACYLRSLEIARQSQRSGMLSLIFANLGELEGKVGADDAAEKYFEEGLLLARELEDAMSISVVLTLWSELRLKRDQLALAEQSFQEALHLAREKGIKEIHARSLAGLSKVRYARGDVAAAHQMGQASLDLYTAIHHGDAEDVRAWLASLPELGAAA